VKDASWRLPNGAEMHATHWHDPRTRCFGLLLEGSVPGSLLPQPVADASVLMVFNAWEGALEFRLPARGRARGKIWTRVLDTALATQEEDVFRPGHRYMVTARSMLVFHSP